MTRSSAVLTTAVAVVTTVAVAYFLGTAVGNYITGRKYENDRREQSERILETMENLTVGDTIPDHVFQDMNGHDVRLSDLLSDRTVVTFFQIDCETCSAEIDRLKATVPDSSDYRYFLFVSSFTPAALQDFVRDRQVPLRTLYDNDDEYASIFHVWTFPLNVIVDRNRTVLSIKPTALTETDIREIIIANKAVAGT